MSKRPDETLGDLHDLCLALFGPDSNATKFVAEKIEQSGRDDKVIASEGQVVMLMLCLHQGTPPEEDVTL